MQTYSELYAHSKNLNWLNDIFGVFIKWRLDKKFGDPMREELNALHKQVFPRRKKINHYNLPEEQVAPIVQKWQERGLAYLKCANACYNYLNAKLDALAPSCDMSPQSETVKLYSCDTGCYRSQGYGASKYARGSVEGKARLLEAAGFDVEVRAVKQEYQGKQYGTDFQLWTNAADWQLDALTRQESMVDWAKKCWARGVNPRVYNPFLPYDGEYGAV